MRAAGVRPQGRTHAQSGASGIGGAQGRNALVMHARALAAAAALFSLDELAEFINELPRSQFHLLRVVSKERQYRERTAIVPTPPPVVVTAPSDDDEILRSDEAAAVLKISPDTLYALVKRGDLVPLPRVPKGRLKFRRGDLAPGIHARYSPPHDIRGRQGSAPPARLDPAPARGGPQRDRDDGRPLGTANAQRQRPRRHEPWAPGQAAWRGPPKPGPKGDGGA